MPWLRDCEGRNQIDAKLLGCYGEDAQKEQNELLDKSAIAKAKQDLQQKIQDYKHTSFISTCFCGIFTIQTSI